MVGCEGVGWIIHFYCITCQRRPMGVDSASINWWRCLLTGPPPLPGHFICSSASSERKQLHFSFHSASDSVSLPVFLPPPPHPLPPSLPPSSLLFYPFGWSSGVHLPPRPAAEQREGSGAGGGRYNGSPVAFLHHAGSGWEARRGCCRLIIRRLRLDLHAKVFHDAAAEGWMD